MSKLIFRIFPLFLLLFVAGVHTASAQQLSAYFGIGSATDGATTSSGCSAKQIDDPFDPSGPPTSCVPAPTMGGTFGVFGADFMLNPHLGVNGEYSFRFAQADFLPSEGLKVRPAFYDFNAIYQPISGDSRIVPVLEGGIGGAKLSFYASQQLGSLLNQSQFLFSTNHFQVHGAVGVKLYVRTSMFIKPQVDFHYVPNLNQQYGSNFVPQYTISIGYTFGR
ncbi:MAG: hypothetical protein LAO19_10320 [Acidobacteriia bacterium]|nr:hypothetical protein [Terriglobia bacterium]